MSTRNSVIFIDDLRTTGRSGAVEAQLNTLDILKPALLRGDIQCVTETLPNHYQEIIEKSPWFEHISRVVNIQPLSDKQTLQVLHGLRGRYEKYHAVSYTDDALECAAYNSVRYLPDRYLPGKAVDVFDAAGSRVKLRQSSLPDDIIEVRKRIRFLAWRMENAVANHEFEKARFYGDEERKEQENLSRLRKLHNIDESLTLVVERKDVEQVIARWTGTSSL